MPEKRNNNRLLCAELVELNYRDMAGFQRRRIVNLEDISPAGMCVQLEARVPDGIEVRVCYEGGEFIGEVRYCAFRDTSFFLGIQFAEHSKWSKKQYCPEHLVDPRELIRHAC
jgi:hypothetical protein